ncbi:MAG: PadR family transcriptional regulator [Candidatus Korobacteraceae bacterium]
MAPPQDPGFNPRRPSATSLHYDLHILTIKMKWLYRRRMTFLGPSPDEASTDVIQGTLDMLILKTLSLEPMHGFGIARRVEQISRGVFKVNPGSLLTALQRLERAGWLDAEWQQTENSRRAKYYRLTRAGKKQLEIESADWKRRASAIARLLNAEG